MSTPTNPDEDIAHRRHLDRMREMRDAGYGSRISSLDISSGATHGTTFNTPPKRELSREFRKLLDEKAAQSVFNLTTVTFTLDETTNHVHMRVEGSAKGRFDAELERFREPLLPPKAGEEAPSKEGLEPVQRVKGYNDTFDLGDAGLLAEAMGLSENARAVVSVTKVNVTARATGLQGR